MKMSDVTARFVLSTAAAAAVSAAAAGDFVGFVVTAINTTNSGQPLRVYTVWARFNGPTDTLLNCFNLGAVAGTSTSLTGFWHKDNAYYNSGFLMQEFGTWNPSQTGSTTNNRPFDSYLTVGGQAVGTNTSNAAPSWVTGGNADARSWNRPDLPTNGTLGWFNSNPPNIQGRVGTAPNTATDVRIGQFVLSEGHAEKLLTCTVGYNNGVTGSPVQFGTGTFRLGCWYRDLDGDGFGSAADGTDCGPTPPAGYVSSSTDNCPSISNPDQADCDGDGIGDVWEIATGVSADCDGDLRPDDCEGAALVRRSTALLPISGTTPAETTFAALPRAYGRPPKLVVEATADLGAANDGLLLTVDGAAAGTYFLADGTDCPASPNSATLTYTLPNFNSLVADGSLVVRATAFGAVNSANCAAGGGVRFRLEYDGLPAESDCNNNGQLDSCEIGTGSTPDCNANGKPDSCDIASGTSPDCNANGRPDSCDLALGSSTDLNGNLVPDDCEFVVGGSGYPTIQAAVAAAPPGTVIRVAPGTYSGTLVLDSKPVSLISLAGPATTTISGLGATSSMIAIRSAAANGSVIEGFTFRDGSAGTAAFGVRVGGAMFLDNTTAAIRNCRFIGNATEYGGGIYGIGFSGVIEDCVFEDNSAQFNSGGVQLGFGGTCVFRRNTLVSNAAESGGGMHIVNWSEGAITAVTLEDCDFIDNTASLEGGALLWYGALGADLPVTRCRVVGNVAPDAAFTRIGGSLSFAVTASRFCRNAPTDVIGSIVDGGGNIFSGDCNANGICDADEIASGAQTDCDVNGQLDSCELTAGTAFDCNENGVLDACDIASGTSADVDSNGVPDDCKPDCDGDGLPDSWEIQTGLARDCNVDDVPDNCEIAQDPSKDKNTNGRLDACEFAFGDLNLDGVVNGSDLAVLLAFWGLSQSPVGDLDGDGTVGGADLAILLGNWGAAP